MFSEADAQIVKWLFGALGATGGIGASLRGFSIWLVRRDESYQSRIEDLHRELLKNSLTAANTLAELARGNLKLADENDELHERMRKMESDLEVLRRECETLRRGK